MKSMREQIEAAAAEIRDSGEMIGMSEPWMILPEEMVQLGICEDEWPLMAATYNAYLVFMDIVDPQDMGFDDEQIDAERKRWPQYFSSDCTVSTGDFTVLANAWVNLSAEQAEKAYRKMLLRNQGHFD